MLVNPCVNILWVRVEKMVYPTRFSKQIRADDHFLNAIALAYEAVIKGSSGIIVNINS